MIENVTHKRAMSGSEIARELGTSRQAISQCLKRAVTKVYRNLQAEGVTDGPLDTLLFMREWFGVNDDEDLRQFYDLFSNEIKEEIKADAGTNATS